MERITVGLDFGTHQTKVCIENKSDARNPIYSFFKFQDLDGNNRVILPSIIQINKDDTLSYGFVEKKKSKYGNKFFIGDMPEYPQSEAEEVYNNELKDWYRWQNASQANQRLIYRYFKQSTFSDYKWSCKLSSLYLSIWYLSYILFLLEEKLGQNFAIQMGIPTGSENFVQKKQKAVSLLLSAYYLVEDVFQNDFEKFLSTPIQELNKLTKLMPYSEEKKHEFSILVFPEAYAGLKSLTSQKKIETGMSLVVDIGGGTTDITFFTIENNFPKIYNYSSIPYGINYIIETAFPDLQDKFEANLDLTKIKESTLKEAIRQYYKNLTNACGSLIKGLERSFERTGFPSNRLKDALKNRIVIYAGGGSTYSLLRKQILYFTDVKYVSHKIWDGMTIDEIKSWIPYCPILSTSLGLSISEVNDNVELSTVENIFKHLEGAYYIEDKPRPKWV